MSSVSRSPTPSSTTDNAVVIAETSAIVAVILAVLIPLVVVLTVACVYYVMRRKMRGRRPHRNLQALANDSYKIHTCSSKNTTPTATPSRNVTVTVTNCDGNVYESVHLGDTPPDTLGLQCNPSYGSRNDLNKTNANDTTSSCVIANDTMSSPDDSSDHEYI